MRQILSLIFLVFFLMQASSASPLYELSSNPPNEQPQVFKLPISEGFAATERLAFNSDYTEIYYSLVNGYEPDSGSSIQLLVYRDEEWQPPITLIEEFNSPALSTNGKILFIEGKNDKDVWVMSEIDEGWSKPKKAFIGKSERHYFAETNSGHHYYSSISTPLGTQPIVRDFHLMSTEDKTQPLDLAMQSDFPRDFYIAKDESYLITLVYDLPGKPGPQVVIYVKQADGSWSAPQSLGDAINNTPGAWKWGFYVTDDHQYLFFTSGDAIADTRIYWSRFDGLLQKLKSHLVGHDQLQ